MLPRARKRHKKRHRGSAGREEEGEASAQLRKDAASPEGCSGGGGGGGRVLPKAITSPNDSSVTGDTPSCAAT